MKNILLIASLFFSITAFAQQNNRTLFGSFIENDLNPNTPVFLTIPVITDTLVARTTTDTLTNKTMDGGSNTFSNIPGSALAAGAINSILPSQTGQSGKVLGTNGTSALWVTNGGGGGSFFPTVVGSVGSPILIGSGGGMTNYIPFSGSDAETIMYVSGGNSGTWVITGNPAIQGCNLSGMRLELIPVSDTNQFTISDGNGVKQNGMFTGNTSNLIKYVCDGTTWREEFRR